MSDIQQEARQSETVESQVVDEAKPNSNKEELLANVKVSDDVKSTILENEDLYNLIVNNITTKRSANEEAKKLRLELEEKRKLEKEAEEKALAEQGKWQELATQKEKEYADLQSRYKQSQIESQLAFEANKKGIKKLDYLKLIDTSSLTLDDNFKIEGVDAIIEEFSKNNPDLFQTSNPQIPSLDTGRPTISQGDSLSQQIKEAELRARQNPNTKNIVYLQTLRKQAKGE